jgi:hypothetical protein
VAIRPETLKPVQGTVGNTLEYIGIGNKFLYRTPMAHQPKERTDKWDYMKLQSFCTSKFTRLKRQPTEWEKIFASYTSYKELITRIYRLFKKLNFERINDPLKKLTTEPKSLFFF